MRQLRALTMARWREGCVFDLNWSDVMTSLKCVSRDVLPCMAL